LRRKIQKGGIFGVEAPTPYEQALEKVLREDLKINPDEEMDWWDITCIDQRKNIKNIFEYFVLKNENNGLFSKYWLNYYKDKLENTRDDELKIDLTKPLGMRKIDLNTCGYMQKCVQFANDKLPEVTETIKEALNQFRKEVRIKQVKSEKNDNDRPTKEENDLLNKIKFYISIKEWIQIRGRARIANHGKVGWGKQRDSNICADYTTKLQKYEDIIDAKGQELYLIYKDLKEKFKKEEPTLCRNDTMEQLNLKILDLNNWKEDNDEESYLNDLMIAYNPKLTKKRTTPSQPPLGYLDIEHSGNSGYVALGENPMKNPSGYLAIGDDNNDTYMEINKNRLPEDAGYFPSPGKATDTGYHVVEYSDEPAEYITAVSDEHDGGKSKKNKQGDLSIEKS
jgi:hypothetical protein